MLSKWSWLGGRAEKLSTGIPSLNGYVRFKFGSGGVEEFGAAGDAVVALVGLVWAVEITGETIEETVLFTEDGARLSA